MNILALAAPVHESAGSAPPELAPPPTFFHRFLDLPNNNFGIDGQEPQEQYGRKGNGLQIAVLGRRTRSPLFIVYKLRQWLEEEWTRFPSILRAAEQTNIVFSFFTKNTVSVSVGTTSRT